MDFIGPDRILYTWAKSSSLTTLQATGDVTDLKISLDGSLVTYTRLDGNEHYSLWIISFEDSNAQVMTNNDFVNFKIN
ncbi:hypothetical protein ADM99_13295 [Leptolinea tardivitalis]|uniref:Uncharacterized protein n=1 Tax=Leptolinea tardivitalis TaxID=229920 RepID=A0A0N8GKW9_9CHLR|nr:hypothetical protein ADM99_13295 [Leptolinea tardivitalis]